MNLNRAISIRAVKAAIKQHRDIKKAAHAFGVSYAQLWHALFRHGIRLPDRRDFRRAGFEEAMRRYPLSPHLQAEFVGLSPRQFRASAIRYGLLQPSRKEAA